MEGKKQKTMSLYCQVSSCMGVVDWYFSKSVSGKIFWTTLIVSGLSMTLFQTYGTFQGFLNKTDYKQTISKQSQPRGILFPLVTICNFNRARQSVINATKLDPNVLKYIFHVFPNDYMIPLDYYQDSSQFSIYQQAWEDYLANTSAELPFINFFRTYGHDTEMIIGATYGKLYTLAKFEEVFTFYGRCWRLNFNFTQAVPGSLAGVKLLLDPQLHEYMKDISLDNYYEEGFALTISYGDNPSMSSSMKLAPGTSSDISIKTTKNVISDNPFRLLKKPCRENTTLNVLNITYSPENCLYDCNMKAIYDYCGCILLTDMKSKFPVCNMSVVSTCANPRLLPDQNFEPKIFKIFASTLDCTETCFFPCEDFLTVEATLTTARQNVRMTDEIMNIAQKLAASENYKWSDDYIKEAFQSIIMVKIYFTSKEITVVETSETIDIMTFIGNVGGMLGLWLGISIMSIIQFLYYTSVACAECIFNKQTTQSINEDRKKISAWEK